MISILPSDNLYKTYKKGDKIGRHKRKDSVIGYKYIFNDLTTIQGVCEQFKRTWEPYTELLVDTYLLGTRLYILFEFVIYESYYPELGFGPEFLSFLANLEVELQLYFDNN